MHKTGSGGSQSTFRSLIERCQYGRGLCRRVRAEREPANRPAEIPSDVFRFLSPTTCSLIMALRLGLQHPVAVACVAAETIFDSEEK